MLGFNSNSLASPAPLSTKMKAFCMPALCVQHHEFRDELVLFKQQEHRDVKKFPSNRKTLLRVIVQSY